MILTCILRTLWSSGGPWIYLLVFWLSWPGTSQAGVLISSFANLNLAIPDGSLNGTSDTQTINTSYSEIVSLKVSLEISATDGFTGDLYATLTHGSGYVVLLNRPGRTSANAFGYSDNGNLSVEFISGASNGDVHDYRLTLTGSDTTPISGFLSGLWQPDGRATYPQSVLRTDSRTALLSSFTGLDPNGSWTLFVADVSSGSKHQLDGWGMELTVVPEPGSWVMMSGWVLLGWAVGRRMMV